MFQIWFLSLIGSNQLLSKTQRLMKLIKRVMIRGKSLQKNTLMKILAVHTKLSFLSLRLDLSQLKKIMQNLFKSLRTKEQSRGT